MKQRTLLNIYSASAGSGKTYTLVKEFLRIVLSSDDEYKFRRVLAMTFTNKAANEMKERILKRWWILAQKKPIVMIGKKLIRMNYL